MIAAEQHPCRFVVPSSQRFGAKRCPSHTNHAAKALQKLAGSHIPATLKQLEKAIAKAGAELYQAQEQTRTESRPPLLLGQAPSLRPAATDHTAELAETAEECDQATTSSSTSSWRMRTSWMPAAQAKSDHDGRSNTPPTA